MSKILVTYGTNYGSTKEIAEFITETIKEQNHAVDLYEVSRAPSNLDEYDTVIIGSGIQIGKWTKQAEAFLKKHQQTLKEKKTALFVSCGFVLYPEKHEESTQKFLKDVAEKYGLEPVSLGFFGTCFDFTGKKGIKYNIMVNMIKRDLKKRGIQYGDVYEFRDWPLIKQWTLASCAFEKGWNGS